MDAYGWAVIRDDRAPYVGARLEDLDQIDEEIGDREAVIHAELRGWLEERDDPWLRWQLSERVNNATGVLQFHTHRNHRTSAMWPLLDWIAVHATGSYGLVYVHDDEDTGRRPAYGRAGGLDHSGVFRVWRILDGSATEHADPFLSPIVPRIDPSEWG